MCIRDRGKIIEYTGEGVKALSVPERATITNMGAELGATTSIFPSDEATREFLAAQGREKDFTPLSADADAQYDEHIVIDLGTLQPMAAMPHSPDNVKTIGEIGPIKVDQVCICLLYTSLGEGNTYPDLLPRMAQFELTLKDWAEQNRGARDYVAFANKCWPAFSEEFGFEPCYVNSRMTSQGYIVACEVDIYGALSEYIGACVTQDAVTILDINNTVPEDLYQKEIKGKYDYTLKDIFMGFHCGNTPLCKLSKGAVKYQLILRCV